MKQECLTFPYIVSTSNSDNVEKGNADYEQASLPRYPKVFLKAIVQG